MSERVVSESRGRRRVAGLIAFLAVGALAAFAATPASAFLVRLGNGKELSYEALAGARAPRYARAFDAVFSNLDYSGGPVMPSNTNYTIVWNPANYTGTPFPSGYVAGVNRFLTDVAADSGTASNSYSVATQYNDVAGNFAAYNSAFGRSFTDNSPLPANGCPAPPGRICLTDAQLQSELDRVITSNRLPRDLSHEYFLLTPPDVVSCMDSGGTLCSGQSPVNPVFCAYHAASSTSSSFLYANVPDLAGLNGCDPFWTDAGGSPCSSSFPCPYPNSPADGVLSAVSHEQIESNTDPQPDNAWTDWQSCAPGSPVICGGEIGDKCNNDAYQDPSTTLTGAGAPFNETINGRGYWIQMEWSNQTNQCLDSFTSNGTAVTASYASSQGGSDTLNFDARASTASGGVAEYVWQFNDGPGQQTTTVETTSPTISHTFPAPGNYFVALTAMAGDGTSDGTAQKLLVGPLLNPTAGFSVSPPSALEGTTFSFDGSGSSDPNAGGSIASYRWDFGDGSPAGAGPTTTHVFTAGGYTVTLTVTDNFGRSSSTQRALRVTDEVPSVAFNPPAGLAGTPVAFSGAGADPDGAITAFNWNFGDGGAGSGAGQSHTYSAGGTYNVALTVTDSSGQTASVSHPVSIASPLPPPPPSPTAPPPPRRPPTNCAVPNVIGKSLGAASSAIRAAHCALGKLSGPGKKPRRGPGKHRKWAAVVSRERPGRGSRRAKGTKVKLTLVWKAVKA